MVDYTSASTPPNDYPALTARNAAAAGTVMIQGSAPGAGEVVIASGTSLSAALDLGDQRLHRFVVPAAWTAADVTFQSSADGVTFNDIYDAVDGEVKVAAAMMVPGRMIVVSQAIFFGVRHIKIRSGLSAAPVNQAAARTIALRTVSR